MTNSQIRFLGKLGIINYDMATHEGDANTRLASQTSEILRLVKSNVPEKYKTQFNKLIELLEKTVEKLPGLMIPIRVNGIYNKTAVKYIKLLWEIEDELKETLQEN